MIRLLLHPRPLQPSATSLSSPSLSSLGVTNLFFVFISVNSQLGVGDESNDRKNRVLLYVFSFRGPQLVLLNSISQLATLCDDFSLSLGVGYIMFPLADFCGGQLYQVHGGVVNCKERRKKERKERKKKRKKDKKKKERSLLVDMYFLTGFVFFFSSRLTIVCMYHCAKCVHMYSY
jgi:hypothetical protein